MLNEQIKKIFKKNGAGDDNGGLHEANKEDLIIEKIALIPSDVETLVFFSHVFFKSERHLREEENLSKKFGKKCIILPNYIYNIVAINSPQQSDD